jgi:nitroreductase
MMDISEAIAGRKSVRAYLDKPVPADHLAKIVEAGQWANNSARISIHHPLPFGVTDGEHQ